VLKDEIIRHDAIAANLFFDIFIDKNGEEIFYE
jgi:hypothetical protein